MLGRSGLVQKMARWATLLCATLVCTLALDSNNINWSREPNSNHTVHSDNGLPGRTKQPETVQNSVRRRSSCSSANCDVQEQGSCSHHTQGRQTPPERDLDYVRTRAPEMSSCVRTRDCADGLCCVRYLTGRRCQRIPAEGEACLLRSSAKIRRKLGRCDCSAGLTCKSSGAVELGRVKGQGVCIPQRQGQRKTRHSGKRKRTAERSC